MTDARPRILAVQHDDHLPPGLLAEWACDRGVDLRIVRADRGELPDATDAQAVVVLGAEASAADLHVPWIREELVWLAAVTPSVPVLGVAFGAQVLSVALGGRVRRPRAPWVGWGVGVAGRDSDLPPGAWLCWQRDLVVPPPGGEVRARGLHGVLAYTHGRHLGVQVHPEVTPWLLDWWTHPEHGRPDVPRERLGVARALGPERLEASMAAGRRLFDLLLVRAGVTTAST